MIDPLPQLSAVVLLALVFATAAVSKLKEPETFAAVVANYRILPAAAVIPVAWILPVTELAVAAGLLIPATRATASVATAALMLVFAAAIAVNVRRGRLSIDCGCFRSTLRQPISWWMVLRNLVLAATALLALPDPTARVTGAADYALAGLGAASLFALYLAVGLVTMPPPPRYEDNYHASLGRA